MSTEYALERDDASPIGTFDEVQTVIQAVFNNVQFTWTQSGRDKLRLAEERGIELPPALAKSLETLPALLEGNATGNNWQVTFGLGHMEPVMCIYITLRGTGDSLNGLLETLQTRVHGRIVVSGNERNRLV